MTDTHTFEDARLLAGLRLIIANAKDVFARFERNAQERCPLPDCTLEERETEARAAKEELEAARADFAERFGPPPALDNYEGFLEHLFRHLPRKKRSGDSHVL